MTDTKLSLTWDAYQKNICNGLGLLQQKGEFVDMTIAADGHHVKVHQMVMSLVSPYIKELITSAQSSHPIIFLNRVRYPTLQLILEYIYTGEVLIAKEYLREFLEAGRSLHIKGLMESESVCAADESLLHYVGARKPSEPMNTTESLTTTNIGSKKDTDVKLVKNSNQSFLENEENTGEISRLDDDDDDDDGDDATDHENIEMIIEETQPDSLETKKIDPTTSSMIQYSLSCQGSIQLVINRFLYRLRHTRKSGERLWRCQDYCKKACPGYAVTKGDVVLQRGCAHNHPFHDKQILKRVRNGNMYTAFNAVESVASLVTKRKA